MIETLRRNGGETDPVRCDVPRAVLLSELRLDAAGAGALAFAFLQECHAFLGQVDRAVQIDEEAGRLLFAALIVALLDPGELATLQRALLRWIEVLAQARVFLIQVAVSLREQVARTVDLIESVTGLGTARSVCAEGDTDRHQDNCNFLHLRAHFYWLKFLAEQRYSCTSRLTSHDPFRNCICDLRNRCGVLEARFLVGIGNNTRFNEHSRHWSRLEHDQIVETVNAEAPVNERPVFALDRCRVIKRGRFASSEQLLTNRLCAGEALLIMRVQHGHENRVALELTTSSRVDPRLLQRVMMN